LTPTDVPALIVLVEAERAGQAISAGQLAGPFFGPLIGEAVAALSAFTPAEVAAVDRFLHVMRQAVATTRQPDEPGR
jgi:hypothetical protein